MRHTESHFGLEIVGGRVTADNGETWQTLPLSDDDFAVLEADIEHWMAFGLTEEERSDLRELLQ